MERPRPRVWLMLSLLAISTTWLYMNRVLLPWEQYFNVDAGTMKAALGDLYPPWFGTRALLIERQNPYGPAVTHEIQMAFYGRDVVQNRDPAVLAIDEQRFAYPVYVTFLLAPVARVKFESLHAVAPAILALVTLAGVWIWMSVLRWRPSAMTTTAVALFVLASPQAAQGLRLRQLGLLVAALFALSVWLIGQNRLAVAGIVLAICTIKPQMIVLPLAWLLIWSLGDVRRRWPLPAGLFVSAVLLVSAGELLLPGWLRDFLNGLSAYRTYGPVTTWLQLAIGNRAGAGMAVVVIIGLMAFGWMNRRCAAGSPEFILTLSTFLISAAIALPLLPPFNQVLLILPLLVLLRDWGKLPKYGRLAFAACVAWPWMVSLVLLIWPPQVKSLRPLPLLPSALVLLFPILLTLLLVMRRPPIRFRKEVDA